MRVSYGLATDMIGAGRFAEGLAIYENIFDNEAVITTCSSVTEACPKAYPGNAEAPLSWAKIVLTALGEITMTQHFIGSQVVHELSNVQYNSTGGFVNGSAYTTSYGHITHWDKLASGAATIELTVGTYHDWFAVVDGKWKIVRSALVIEQNGFFDGNSDSQHGWRLQKNDDVVMNRDANYFETGRLLRYGRTGIGLHYDSSITLSKSGTNYWNSVSQVGQYMAVMGGAPAFVGEGLLSIINTRTNAVEFEKTVYERVAPLVLGTTMYGTSSVGSSSSVRDAYVWRLSLDGPPVYEETNISSVMLFNRPKQYCGTLAVFKKDDETCERIYVSRIEIGYNGGTSSISEPNDTYSRIRLKANTNYRGAIECVCANTGNECPNWQTYVNGKYQDTYEPTQDYTVSADFVNVDRSQYTAALSELSCGDAALSMLPTKLVPLYIVATLSGNVSLGDVLTKSGTTCHMKVVDVLSNGKVHLQYHLAHWDYCTEFDDNNILSVESMRLDSVRTTVAPFDEVDGVAKILYTDIPVVDMNTPVSLAPLTAHCTGMPANTSLTYKRLLAIGDTFSGAEAQSMYSTGSSFWSPSACTVHETSNSLVCVSGNGYLYSIDRYFSLRDILLTKQAAQLEWAAAATAGDNVAFRQAVSQFASANADLDRLISLLGEKDKYFYDVSVHAIDLETGALKWITPLADSPDPYVLPSTDTFHPAFTGETLEADYSHAAAEAHAWDWDAVFASSDTTNVYVGTKGGIMAKLNATNGSMLYEKRMVQGGANEDTALNFGKACLTPDGVMVGSGTVKGISRDNAYTFSSDNYTSLWMTEDGTPLGRGDVDTGLTWALDMTNEKVLWEKPMTSRAHGFTCAAGRVFTVCPDDETRACVLNIQTGREESRFPFGDRVSKTITVRVSGRFAYVYTGGDRVHKYEMFASKPSQPIPSPSSIKEVVAETPSQGSCSDRAGTNTYGIDCATVAIGGFCDHDVPVWTEPEQLNSEACPFSCGTCPVACSDRAGTNTYGIDCATVAIGGFCDHDVPVWTEPEQLNSEACPFSCGTCPVACSDRAGTNTYGIDCATVAIGGFCDHDVPVWTEPEQLNSEACPFSCGTCPVACSDRAGTNTYGIDCATVAIGGFCDHDVPVWTEPEQLNSEACPFSCGTCPV